MSGGDDTYTSQEGIEMQKKDKHQPPPSPSDSNRPLPDADLIDQPLEEDKVSGTGIAGDETNVRTREGVEKPGIANKLPPKPK